MKVSPVTAAGRRLLGWGVTDDEPRSARCYAFDLQVGGAITIALPVARAVILMRRKYLVRTQDGSPTGATWLWSVTSCATVRN